MCDDKLHKGAQTRLFHYARENRQQATEAEKILWQHLRNRKLNGFKFRRQNPIGDFVADFYCVECNLVIEIDGEYHTSIEQRQYDEGRTYELSELKINVVRFTNEEVCENINHVLKEIEKHLIPAER
jgi:very-short-patch-repair endonuclease